MIIVLLFLIIALVNICYVPKRVATMTPEEYRQYFCYNIMGMKDSPIQKS